MQHAIDRLKAEFLEMPGLQLTAPQVQRLCGLEPALCQAVLDALVASNFLQCFEGRYSLPAFARTDRLRPARVAHLPRLHDKRAS
jgi:hypothetical protein